MTFLTKYWKSDSTVHDTNDNKSSIRKTCSLVKRKEVRKNEDRSRMTAPHPATASHMHLFL